MKRELLIMPLKNKRAFIPKGLLAVCICFLLFQPIQAFAAEPLLDKDQLTEGNKPSIIEKHLSKLLINAGNWLLDLSNAQDVTTLVFQRPEVAAGSDAVLPNKSSADRKNMYFGIFPSGLFDAISAFNSFFTSLLPIPMVILLSGGGLFLLFDIMRSNEVRSKAKEMLLGVVSAVILIRFGHILWEWIIDINYVLVDGIYAVLAGEGITITRFTNTIWDSSQFTDLSASQTIGVATLLICAIGMTFVMNYQYTMRLIQLSMLIVLFPFVLLSCIIPSRKSALNLWFTTFSSNIFMQAGHAAALGLFFFSMSKASELNFWLIMAMLFGLPAMADLVNRMVGAFTGEGGGGGIKTSASNMSGIAGLMAISKIGSTIAGNKGKPTMKNEQTSTSQGSGAESVFSSKGNNLSADTGITQGNGSAPLGSDLKEGSGKSVPVGSINNAPVSKGARALHNISSLAKATAKGAGKFASSERANSLIRGAAIMGTAGAGAIAGTMTTGSAGPGAFVGSQAGRSLGTAGNFAREKLSKGIQAGSEVLAGGLDKKLGETDGALDYTKGRLGYSDNAQLYDSQEMGRMGQELIGGKTGQALGQATGAVGNFVAGHFGTPAQKQAVAKVKERRSLGDQIVHSRGLQEEAKQGLDTARLQHNHVNSQFGPGSAEGQKWQSHKQAEYENASRQYKQFPNSEQYRQQYEQAKSNLNQPHPEVQMSQQKVNQHEANYNQHAFQTRQLEQKQQNFYKIQRQAEEMRDFQSNVRSSGRL